VQNALFGYAANKDNLVHLTASECSPPAILHQLRERYRSDHIYTSIGRHAAFTRGDVRCTGVVRGVFVVVMRSNLALIV